MAFEGQQRGSFRAALLGASLFGGLSFASSLMAAVPVLPIGGNVVAGTASITTSGSTLTVDQTTAKAIITWSSFSIGQGAAVKISNGSGATLNRVTGLAPSQIDGLLSSTGTVYIVNANGVIIGKTGVVNTGGTFVASTLDVTNDNVLAGGPLTFTGPSTASIVNLGKVGSLGGNVALIARSVTNAGAVTAPSGTIGFASGSLITLTDDTADDGGLIKVQIGEVGDRLTNEGALAAAAIELRAQQGNIYALAGNTGGTIDATGVADKGGRIFLVNAQGETTVTGTLDAQGPGGAPGSIETSGQTLQIGSASINAHGGNWLLDPTDLTIDKSAATTIDNSLNAGTSVVEKTDGSGASGKGVKSSGDGDIIIDAALSWASAATLTLDSYHSIFINAPITVSGAGGVSLTTNDGGTGGDYSFGLTSAGFAGSLSFTGAEGGGQRLTINGDAYTLIYSMAEMASEMNYASGAFALAESLNASGVTYGGAVVALFQGQFTGLGHTITGLTINDSSGAGDDGLFGQQDGAGEIRDIGLLGGSVSSTENDVLFLPAGGNVGALVGLQFSGAITDAYATGAVSGSSDVGGLVGKQSYGTITGSYAAGPVSGFSGVGGLVGFQSAGAIANAYATGAVTGMASLGGSQFVGGLVGSLSGGTITDAFATGAVFGANFVGGLVGSTYVSTITSAYATGAVAGSVYVGGLVGEQNNGAITNVNAAGPVSGANKVGGLVGEEAGGVVTNAFATGAVSGTMNVGGLVGSEGTSTITNTYATGAVTGSTYTGGLVGDAAFGTITDAYATGAVSGRDYAGGLVGYQYEIAITDAYATGAVLGRRYAGGLVGYQYEGAITDVYATGGVSGLNKLGGLVGYDDDGAITDAYATGAVTGKSNVGGLVGDVVNYSTIKDAFATGAVSGHIHAGGLVGYKYKATITQGYWDIQTTGRYFSAAGVGLGTARFQSGAALGLGAAFGGGTGGLYPYLTNFFPNGVEALVGDAPARSQVAIYAGGAELGGGTVSTGADGYVYLAVPSGTLAASGNLVGEVLTLARATTPSALTYSDALAVTGNLMALPSLTAGTVSETTGENAYSGLQTDLATTFGVANLTTLASALAASPMVITANGANGLTVDQAVNAGSSFSLIASAGGVTLSAPITAGGSILIAADGNFTNTAGADALTSGSGDGYTIYSQSAANPSLAAPTDKFDGLSGTSVYSDPYDFSTQTFAVTPPPGNSFVFAHPRRPGA